MEVLLLPLGHACGPGHVAKAYRPVRETAKLKGRTHLSNQGWEVLNAAVTSHTYAAVAATARNAVLRQHLRAGTTISGVCAEH
jgi:hypothetical protein